MLSPDNCALLYWSSIVWKMVSISCLASIEKLKSIKRIWILKNKLYRAIHTYMHLQLPRLDSLISPLWMWLYVAAIPVSEPLLIYIRLVLHRQSKTNSLPACISTITGQVFTASSFNVWRQCTWCILLCFHPVYPKSHLLGGQEICIDGANVSRITTNF
jgi:hypothetical protein